MKLFESKIKAISEDCQINKTAKILVIGDKRSLTDLPTSNIFYENIGTQKLQYTDKVFDLIIIYPNVDITKDQIGEFARLIKNDGNILICLYEQFWPFNWIDKKYISKSMYRTSKNIKDQGLKIMIKYVSGFYPRIIILRCKINKQEFIKMPMKNITPELLPILDNS